VSHLSQTQLDELRHTLQQEQADLERHFALNDQFGLDDSQSLSTGELSAYDNHPADLGSETFERGKDIALNENAEHHLEQARKAIERMDTGQYGHCTVCGEAIPFDRLQAIPAASTCKEHAIDTSVSHNRPVEEQVLPHPFGRTSFDENDSETEFDGEDAWQIVESWGTSNTPAMAEDPNVSDYNDMSIEADEHEGYVEPLESFLATDIYGQNVTVVRNRTYKQYIEHNEGDPLLEPDVHEDV
jgi:YteA family regulatory protein